MSGCRTTARHSSSSENSAVFSTLVSPGNGKDGFPVAAHVRRELPEHEDKH